MTFHFTCAGVTLLKQQRLDTFWLQCFMNKLIRRSVLLICRSDIDSTRSSFVGWMEEAHGFGNKHCLHILLSVELLTVSPTNSGVQDWLTVHDDHWTRAEAVWFVAGRDQGEEGSRYPLLWSKVMLVVIKISLATVYLLRHMFGFTVRMSHICKVV